ncbi:3-phosphoshikimate 1-carboxyvinyltransferase [Serpentinicella alkaliphila]|uniref:3-phosphoshikimate 1-carboxyvinyltransferase n=1 Tax=Serpentinicella alkaliphila TaxID=1734049 RepID=UPI001404E2B4|nr:3-phosphoshikimate 1-carboxyvinyltransferase [Serpentinicella alkaliphila]QUH24833.1 3-phosphoshikimate 1-carboxyvinyltransferase [Serpentinicella alkaliphila]
MKVLITSKVSKIQGKIKVPGDKSISHRAIMLASISEGKSVIDGFLFGEDCLSTVSCFRKLGISININEGQIEVEGKGLYGLSEPEDILDAGNSGTTMRLMTGILAGQSFLSIITGDDSLRKRPMERIALPLRKMGASINGRKGGKLAPVVIEGKNLEGIEYILPVSSAQIKSAVLLAGLYADGETTVEEDVQSRDHTEKMLEFFGAKITKDNNRVTVSPSVLKAQNITVPGDISSAAFFMAAAAAIPGSYLIIEGVGINQTRSGIIDVLTEMGAKIQVENIKHSGGEEIGDIHIEGVNLKGVNISKAIIPRLIDEIPVLAVIAAKAEGITRITGAEELKVKETNRISTMVSEMKKVGIEVNELPDGMEIIGGSKINGGTVESHGDHRVAMAMAICGLLADEPIKILGNECIDISFPDFENILKSVCSY